MNRDYRRILKHRISGHELSCVLEDGDSIYVNGNYLTEHDANSLEYELVPSYFVKKYEFSLDRLKNFQARIKDALYLMGNPKKVKVTLELIE